MGNKKEELEVCVQLQGYDVMGSLRHGRIAQVTGTLMDAYRLFRTGQEGGEGSCPICERVAGIHGTLLGKGGELAESLWVRILYVHFRSVNSR